MLLLLLPLLASAYWPPIWPYPQHFKNGTEAVLLNFNLEIDHPAAKDLELAVERFQSLAFLHRTPRSTGISKVLIEVKDPTAVVQLETSEDYNLTVPSDPKQVTD